LDIEKFRNVGIKNISVDELYDLAVACGSIRAAARVINASQGWVNEKLHNYCKKTGKPFPAHAPSSKEDKEPQPPSITSLLKANTALRRENERLLGKVDIIIDILRTEIQALPPAPSPKIHTPKKAKGREQIASLLLGDWHVGEKVESTTVAGLTEYNYGIFLERVDMIQNAIYSIIEKERTSCPINRLIINILGDMITGEICFDGQAQQIDLALYHQYTLGARRLALFIRDMAGFFNQVDVRAIPGNHPEGRKGQQKKHPLSKEEVVFLFMTGMYLAEQDNVTFVISPCTYMVYEIFDKKFLLLHGHEARRHMRVPYYAMDRLVPQFVQLFRINLDYVYLGHHHVGAEIEQMYTERFHNGSLVGGSHYSITGLQEVSFPLQKLHGIHPDWGVTWRYNLKAGEPVELTPDENGIYTPTVDVKDLGKL